MHKTTYFLCEKGTHCQKKIRILGYFCFVIKQECTCMTVTYRNQVISSDPKANYIRK